MARLVRTSVAFILCFWGLATAVAAGPSDAGVAELLANRLSGDIVSIELTAVLQAKVGGRALPARSRRMSVSGLVISGHGLVVTALSAIDPQSAFRTSRAVGGNGPTSSQEDVSSELKDLKMIMADGRMLPVRIAATDEMLDLAFLLPEAQDDANQINFPPVSLAEAAESRILGDYYVISRSSKALGRTLTFRPVVLIGIVETPRPVFLLNAPVQGAPVFDGNGRLLGIVTQYLVDGLESGYVVLPAAEIAKRARSLPDYSKS